MRFAAIDIGSNAVRLLISDINELKPGEFHAKKNTLLRIPLRLGDDAFLDKLLSERKVEDLVKTMTAFKNLMEVYKVSSYRACATSAMRESRNGSEVVSEIAKRTGINITIIEGRIEADIIHCIQSEWPLDKRKNYLYIDVGGGSTEISLFIEGQHVESTSFDIGTIRMLDNQDADATWMNMKNWLKEKTARLKNLQAIGTGGNINKLFRLSEQKEGTPLTVLKLKALYNYLNSFSLKERMQILELRQDRADVIIPASEIYLAAAKWAGFKQIIVPKTGLVDGIIQQLIGEYVRDNG